MSERDVPRRRPGRGLDGSHDPYADPYYESGYEDQTGQLGQHPRYAGRWGNGAMPADRGGSGPHFYGPGAMSRSRGAGLPDIDDEDDEPSNWRRRTAMVAIGGGAAALIGGGAYAVTQFFGKGTRPAADNGELPVDTAAPAYVDQNQSLMNGQAGLGIRKNTPTTGSSFGTPADAAKNAVVVGNTVLPKKDSVRHLASRLTFGPNSRVISDINKLGIDGWIAKQLKPETIPLTRGEQKADAELITWNMSYEQLKAQREDLGKKGIRADEQNVRYAIAKQLFSDRQLFEMLVDFFNDYLHVAAFHDGNELVRAAFERDVVRKHALGNYVDMFLAANKHPALLRYLDQQSSTKDQINENLARENLELYTVGAFNGYNETDVRQAAMLQTGRSIRDNQYVYRPEQHYVGPVKIMGFSHANNSAEGGEAVQEAYFRYLALHPNTARYMAQNLATRFVSDVPPKTLVDAMAKTYIDKKSNITAVLMTMLSRTEFWASVGQKVRRPGEYLTATYRALDINPDAPAGFTSNNTNVSPFVQGLGDIVRKLEEFGHAPMELPTPNGYPDVYVAWTSAGTMVNQWNDAYNAVVGNRRQFTWQKPEAIVAEPPNTAGAYLDALSKKLINVTLDNTRKTAILKIAGPNVTASTPVDATFNGAIAAVVRALFTTPHHYLR
ncbi:DUF1800 domain-containing protein [Dactylosporangium roseum]|uniref:DUF1800 domain-containing protein n=1 Tax=Dactylosporangium roseum TaxID=47989 RepID=A0ABY5Z4J2_9ACTN|nr:DUF1800 domain-containing protein [Dactylosporangium roseum]UWZ36966.1 DUF1800 domain-containing protein [Dactylosporangium roseum]